MKSNLNDLKDTIVSVLVFGIVWLFVSLLDTLFLSNFDYRISNVLNP